MSIVSSQTHKSDRVVAFGRHVSWHCGASVRSWYYERNRIWEDLGSAFGRSAHHAGWTADSVADAVKNLGYLAVTVISESPVYSSIGTKSIKVRVGTGHSVPSASPVSDCVFTGTMDVWIIVVWIGPPGQCARADILKSDAGRARVRWKDLVHEGVGRIKNIVNISLMALDYDEGVSAITENKLMGTNMSLPKSFLNDDVPFPKVWYVSVPWRVLDVVWECVSFQVAPSHVSTPAWRQDPSWRIFFRWVGTTVARLRPWKKNRLEPKQHPIEKENHLPSTSILGLKFVHVPGLV